jgi:hypothetical protein
MRRSMFSGKLLLTIKNMLQLLGGDEANNILHLYETMVSLPISIQLIINQDVNRLNENINAIIDNQSYQSFIAQVFILQYQ